MCMKVLSMKCLKLNKYYLEPTELNSHFIEHNVSKVNGNTQIINVQIIFVWIKLIALQCSAHLIYDQEYHKRHEENR